MIKIISMIFIILCIFSSIYELESKYLDIPMNSLCCSVDSLNIHENLQVDERFEWQNKNDIFEVLSRIGAREKIVATFHRKVTIKTINIDIKLISERLRYM